MQRITDRDGARRAQDLDFCYLCGQPFTDDNPPTKDHVPPSKIFDKEDRDFALWLPAHDGCNCEQSGDDELMAQLFGFVHGTPPSESKLKLEFQGMEDTLTGSQTVGLADPGLQNIVFRWIRGFHAALYREYVPDELPLRAIHMPFPSGRQLEDGLHWDDIRDQHPMVVEQLKKAHVADTYDAVVIRNEKCRYECTWGLSDRSEAWCCLFGLQLYDWSRIGDSSVAKGRGCVGMYVPPSGKPATASRITRLEFPVPNVRTLHPFDD